MIRSADDFDVIQKRLAELKAERERAIAADPDAPPAAAVPLVITETASGLAYETEPAAQFAAQQSVFSGAAFASAYAPSVHDTRPCYVACPLAPDGWAMFNDMRDMPVPLADGDPTASLIAWAELRSFVQ